MKVYKLKKDGMVPQPTIMFRKAGHLIYEGKDYYYPAGGGYAIRKKDIEESGDFERIEDDPNTPEYYNEKKYTEHEMQTALKKIQP